MVGPHRSPLSPAVSPRGEEGGMVGPHRSPLSPIASGRGKVGAGEEERWPPHAMVACWECVPLARILMDGTGGTGVSAGAAERAWRPSSSPLAPLPLPRCGRGRGDGRAAPFAVVPCRFATGRGRGDGRAAPFAVVPCRFATGRGRGDGRAAPFAVVPCRKRKGEGGGWRRRTLAPHAMGTRARYVPNKKFRFLIRL